MKFFWELFPGGGALPQLVEPSSPAGLLPPGLFKTVEKHLWREQEWRQSDVQD